ncbi:unnamed protein product [Fusarium fujikuroi]|nr:unnamed protein product [Fusarium fujikuroi]
MKLLRKSRAGLNKNWAFFVRAPPNFTIIFEAGGRRYVTTEAIPFQSQDNTSPESQLVTVFANLDGVVLSKALFLSGVVMTAPHRAHAVPQDSWEYLQELGMKWLEIVEGDETRLPSGPYFYADNKLYPVLKDCFLVRGMEASICSRAYYELSEHETFTADVIQSLIDDGAYILGLTKLSSMIAREEPMDAIDYPAAFNPRGDGYQSPAGSSNGSAAAVASYNWLDCAIGTDTSGSGRRPALANGIWQFRPSHDSISLRGLVKTYALFDTPCVFARSLDVIRRVAKTWIAAPLDLKKRPYRLIYPLDYLPTEIPEQMKIIGSFIQDLETHLSATIIPLSIRSSWYQSHPPEASDNVEQYLHDVIRRTFYHQFYHSTASFRQLYAERHDGQQPYVIPFVRRRWTLGASVSDAEHEEATRRLLTYRKWLHNQFFGDENFVTFAILPVAEVKPVYRDEKVESPETQSACDQLFLPPILGSPDVVLPIGETPYHSKISNKIEYLPVVANIVAAPGRDHELLEAVHIILERSGRSQVVHTGSKIFIP